VHALYGACARLGLKILSNYKLFGTYYCTAAQKYWILENWRIARRTSYVVIVSISLERPLRNPALEQQLQRFNTAA